MITAEQLEAMRERDTQLTYPTDMAHDDRRALLAEVDRLRSALAEARAVARQAVVPRRHLQTLQALIESWGEE